MGKKFMGLGGTDHFWDRAKTWILNQITSAVAAKIAEIVANAPEDLDTLKEIADWIKTHANDAAAMNTQIQTNKDNIAANTSDISAMNTQITENKNNIAALSDDAAAMNTAILANTEAINGKADIVDTAIEIDSTWSSKKISADLADKQDFRIFNSLEEFNEKKGTSLTVVSGIDNMKDIANAMSNGEILIIIVKYELGSEVYFGLTRSTGWTKMFTFIKSNGLCDVECRTTFPLTIKRVLNSDGVIGDWQELATMDKVAHEVDTSYMSNGVLNISSIRQSLGAGCYEIMGQGNSGHGSIRLNIWQVVSGAFVFSCCITDTGGVRRICNNEGASPTVDVGTPYFNTTNKIIKIF